MKLQTGDIVLIQRNRLISKLIRCFTKSKWSHSRSIFVKACGTYVVEAEPKGVKTDFYFEFDGNYSILRAKKYKDGIPYDDDKAIRQLIKKQIGKKYDYRFTLIYQPCKQIVYTHLKVNPFKFRKTKFYKWFIRPAKRCMDINTFRSDKYFACSELSGYLLDLKNWHGLSPEGIYRHEELIIIKENK